MNDDVFKGKWLQLKGQIKEKWGHITDDELDQIAGQRDQLVGRSRSATAWRRTPSTASSTR